MAFNFVVLPFQICNLGGVLQTQFFEENLIWDLLLQKSFFSKTTAKGYLLRNYFVSISSQAYYSRESFGQSKLIFGHNSFQWTRWKLPLLRTGSFFYLGSFSSSCDIEVWPNYSIRIKSKYVKYLKKKKQWENIFNFNN